MKRRAVALLFVLPLVGCVDPQIAPDYAQTDPALYVAETIVSGLDHPWGIAFLPDGTMLVTERSGQLRLIEDGVLRPEPVEGVPPVLAEGQGGLFDIVLAPDFAETGRIYLSLASGDADANATAVFRARYADGALVEGETIFTSSPAKDTDAHFGGRMVFGPDGALILTLGDGFAYREQAQDRTNQLGTIVRMTADGEPAPGNPFLDEGDAAAWIWSYGHRNVQGLAWDRTRGALWSHEHGPRGGDELNRIEPGSNYGWPIATFGTDYNFARISPFEAHDGFAAPVHVWTPSIAPAGLAAYDGALFPDWRGDLFVAALAGQAIHRLDLDAAGAVVGEERLLTSESARVRHIAQGPDGALYALTDSEDGAVIRITAPLAEG